MIKKDGIFIIIVSAPLYLFKCCFDADPLLWKLKKNSQLCKNVNKLKTKVYPIELEIKDTTDTDRSASYLDLHLEIDSEGRIRTKLYDKRDDINFPIVNFTFICSNIPAAPAYGVYIFQLIRYSRSCGSPQDFCRHHNLVYRYGIYVSK